jgi:hypothetical protein
MDAEKRGNIAAYSSTRNCMKLESMFSLAHCCLIVALSMVISGAASAASFLDATYERTSDELVVRIAYRGTHPDHQFSLQWDECEEAAANGSYQISARVIDSHWNDRARRDFERVVRFALNDLQCRPATVTLFIEPNFRISVEVPAFGGAGRELRGPRTDGQ